MAITHPKKLVKRKEKLLSPDKATPTVPMLFSEAGVTFAM